MPAVEQPEDRLLARPLLEVAAEGFAVDAALGARFAKGGRALVGVDIPARAGDMDQTRASEVDQMVDDRPRARRIVEMDGATPAATAARVDQDRRDAGRQGRR